MTEDLRTPMRPPAPSPRVPAGVVPRVLRGVALGLCASAASACGDARAPRAAPELPPLDDAAVADTSWEARFDESERTGSVEGRLVVPREDAAPDAEFPPCADALVEVFLTRPDGRAVLDPIGAVRSGPDGTFRLDGVPPDGFALRASKAGFATTLAGRGLRIPGSFGLPTDPGFDLWMRPAATLDGEVVDRSGAAAAGVSVAADTLAYTGEAVTDASGRFTLEVPVGPLAVTVRDPRRDVVRAEVTADGGGRRGTVRIVAEATEVLAGRVVASEDRRPLPGAIVTSLDGLPRTVRTDADGRFRLEVPRWGRVAAFAAGRAWRSWEIPRAGELEIGLGRGRRVVGWVRDRDGRPVAEARLLAVVMNREGQVEVVRGPATDASGRFDFSWIPAQPRGIERPPQVLAWHRRRGFSAPVPVPADTNRDLVLGGMRSLTGSLSDPRGAPVRGADAVVEWTFPGLTQLESVALPLPRGRDTRSVADGTFRFVDVPADVPVKVRVEAYGLTFERDVAADATESIPLSLPEGRTVTGTVVRRDGTPPGSAGVVKLRLLEGRGIHLARDVPIGADGAFRFDDVPPGRYRLEGTAEGFDLPGFAEAQAGDGDVRLVVERTARATVRVELPADAPAIDVPLVLWVDDLVVTSLPAKKTTLFRPGDAGPPREFPLPLRPGRWRLRVEGGIWRGRSDELVLGDGEERVVAVRVEPTLRIGGVLRDGDGTPMSGVPVLFLARAPVKDPRISVWSSDGGVVDVVGLVPGPWEVRVAPRLHAALRVELDITPETRLDLRLPPQGGATVRVRSTEGEPVGDAIVALTDVAGKEAFGWSEVLPSPVSRFRTDAAGAARILGLPAGSYRVAATVGSRRLGPKAVEVPAGGTVEVVLE